MANRVGIAHQGPFVSEHIGRQTTTGLMQVACTLLVLTAFLPYPGLPIGDNTGLEMYSLVALALLPLALQVGIEWRYLAAVILLLLPSFTSAAIGATLGRIEEVEVVAAVLMGSLVSLLPFLLAGMFLKKEYFPSILRGLCIALIIHVAAGAYQVYAFSQGFFPFLNILRNPGYMDLAPKANEWVTYIRRPFGLFPEPSAMAAAIGPWLILGTALLLYPHLAPAPLGKGLRVGLLAATLGGIWLVIWSRSGFVVPMIVALALIALPRALQAAAQFYIVRRLAFVLLTVTTIWMIVVFTQAQFGNRLETSTADDPWEERRSSLEIALTLPTRDPVDLLIGLGPGQSTLFLQQEEGIDTVFSLTIRQWAENGLMGVMCTAALYTMVIRAVFRSSARFLGYTTAAVWLICVTVVTSYGMSGAYLFLAMLLSWDRIFPAANRRPSFLRTTRGESVIWERAE